VAHDPTSNPVVAETPAEPVALLGVSVGRVPRTYPARSKPPCRTNDRRPFDGNRPRSTLQVRFSKRIAMHKATTFLTALAMALLAASMAWPHRLKTVTVKR